ncbi:peptidase M20 [Bryobacterales bacterium F-183]|nr:peptidase M20 [Bryobacterales bacterium F-183]
MSAAALFLAASLTAQYPTSFTPDIAQRPDVQRATTWIDANFKAQVDEWVRLAEVPAPSGKEQRRAAYIKAELEKLNYKPTSDSSGNVWVRRNGTGGGPTLVFAAHMDTVFPENTNVKVTRTPDGKLLGAGIADDTASVVNLLNAIRAIEHAKLQTKADLIFLFTVQEEVGLKGMYAWLENNRKDMDLLVALDGDLGAVRYGALGIYWSKMKFTGPGAHTNRSKGAPNPVRAAAQCITDIYTVPLPGDHERLGTVYNIGGMMSSGNIVNAVPQEVTFTVDLRTVDKSVMGALDDALLSKCDQAARAHGVTFAREWIQKSEPGGTPEDLVDRRRHHIVQTAIDILKHLGVKLLPGEEAIPNGSTDANVGVVNGIPSVAVGRAYGGGQHTSSEWSLADSARIGTKQIILLAASLTQK